MFAVVLDFLRAEPPEAVRVADPDLDVLLAHLRTTTESNFARFSARG
jgi:hypothetical protein